MVKIGVLFQEKEKYEFADLVEVMRILRSPAGCPWDREQTLESLKPYCEEEAGEVVSAMERVLESGMEDGWDELCEELGDLLLQVVFQARLAEELNKFGAGEVVDGIVKKLVRRHPHVFGETSAETSGEVLTNWKAIKNAEKAAKLEGRELSALEAEGMLKNRKD